VDDRSASKLEIVSTVETDIDRAAHLSVTETSLGLDLRDDFQLSKVDLQPLVDAASDLLLRTPRSAVTFRANPTQRVHK